MHNQLTIRDEGEGRLPSICAGPARSFRSGRVNRSPLPFRSTTRRARTFKGAPAADLPVLIVPQDQVSMIGRCRSTPAAGNRRRGFAMVGQCGKSSGLCRIARLAALAMLLAGPLCAQAAAPDAGQQWQALNAQVMEAYRAGDYGRGLTLAEQAYQQALQGSQETLGPRHPDTLATQLNTVVLLVNQGRQQEAVRTLQAMEANLPQEPQEVHPPSSATAPSPKRRNRHHRPAYACPISNAPSWWKAGTSLSPARMPEHTPEPGTDMMMQ